MWLIAIALCCTVAFHSYSTLPDPGEQTVQEIVTNPYQFTSREVVVAGVVGSRLAVMGESVKKSGVSHASR